MEKGFEIKSSKISITHPHVTDGSYQVYLTYDAEGEDHGDDSVGPQRVLCIATSK